jgi:TonB-linked SusC/RagA family outer membrane protein
LRVRSSILTAVALALAIVRSASGQTERITGRTTDADSKDGVPAVQVIVTGTTIGAVTNDSGRFTLRNVPADAKTITVRRIGYRGTVIPIVAGQTEYAIVLTRDVLQLEQQVVTGVATTVSSRNASTYDPVVTSEQLNGAPTPTIENALQGKVPGVLVEQNSGAPGGGLQVNVRGVTTINANSQPLYVVDGVIMSNETSPSGLNTLTNAGSQNGSMTPGNQDQSVNRIADLNPNDIESMQVLEGGAAASIYGSRAAAGVVVITTKKGQPGKAQIDVSQKFGTFNLENELNTRHFTLPQAQALVASNPAYSSQLTPAQVAQNFNECHGYCDFEKQLYGGGELSDETDLEVRGGLNQTTYFLSGLTKYDNGAQINTGYNKQSARANVHQTIFNTIDVSANIAYTGSLTRRGVNGNDNLGIAGYDVISYTPSFFNMSAKNPDGSYVKNPFGPANAFQDANEIQTPEEVNRTTLGGTATWKLFTNQQQSLQIAAQGGADFANVRDQFAEPADLQVQQSALVTTPGVSSVTQGYDRLSNYSVSLIHTLTPSSLISATTSIGLTRGKEATYLAADAGAGLVPGVPAFTGASTLTPFYLQTEANETGYYAQEQLLLFNERLSLTGGINAERSTSDGNINKFFYYPKAAGSFRVFTGDNELKVRFAYGQAGNLPIYGVRYTASLTTNYSGISGIRPDEVVGDPTIRPETNTSFEGGLDLTMFKGRAELDATVFQKRVTNMLLEEAILPSSGAQNQWANGGELTNQGLELALNATPIQAGKFTWTTTETFSRIYNIVNNIPVPTFVAGQSFGFFPFGGYQIAQGASPNAVWGNNAAGNLVQLGNAAPAITVGFGQNLEYGPLHLHAFFDWRDGMTTSDLTQEYFDGAFGFSGNLQDTAAANKRIKELNSGITAYAQHSSFLKLRELTLKYDLPSSLVNTVGHNYLRNVSLSLTGRNLVTWTKYPGLDPEVSNFGTQQIGRGQDVTPYPPTRSYFISIDVGF